MLYSKTNINFLFNILEACKGVEQDSFYHPEGDVFNHSLQSLHVALRESDDIDLIMAAMLHDIGKCIDSKGHDQYAMDILDGYVSEKTLWLINHHMRIWYFLTGEMKKLKKVKDFYTHEWFKDVVLLARWDKLARNPNKKIKYNREKLMSIILEKVLND